VIKSFRRRVAPILSAVRVTVDDMDHRSELLMTLGVVGACDDCRDERLLVPVDDGSGYLGAFCCTTCGAATLIDPLLTVVEPSPPGTSLVS